MRIFNYHFTYLFGFALALTFSLSHYYVGGSIVLGGEGNYLLDYSENIKIASHQWVSRFGLGSVSLSPGANTTNLLFLVIIENLFHSDVLTNFSLIFSIYFLPFLGMYLISNELKIKPHLCCLVSLFYVVNPFSIHFLSSLNQWNVFSISLIPILFWVVLRYYHDNLKLFLYYGSVSALFSFAYTNHPLNAIINISSILAVYIISYYYNEKFLLLEVAKKYLLVFSAFLLFNCWWLLNLFLGVGNALGIYRVDLAHDWLISTVGEVGNPLAKSLSLTHLVGPEEQSFLGSYFHSFFSYLICLVPIFLVVSGVFFAKRNLRKLLIHILILMLIAIFLLKGAAPPLGTIYLFLFKNVPFFNIFKSSVEKFGLLYIFLLSIFLLFTILATKNHSHHKTGTIIFSGYLLFCTIPLLIGEAIPEISLGDAGIQSRKFKETSSHKIFRKQINNEKLEYKILSLPGTGNYQVLFDSIEGKQYSGIDPLLPNINKSTITPHNVMEFKVFYNKFILNTENHKLFGFFNIGKLVVNGNLYPWFGQIGPGAEKLRNRYKNLPRKNFENVSTHTILQNFIPVVHTTENLIISK